MGTFFLKTETPSCGERALSENSPGGFPRTPPRTPASLRHKDTLEDFTTKHRSFVVIALNVTMDVSTCFPGHLTIHLNYGAELWYTLSHAPYSDYDVLQSSK